MVGHLGFKCIESKLGMSVDPDAPPPPVTPRYKMAVRTGKL